MSRRPSRKPGRRRQPATTGSGCSARHPRRYWYSTRDPAGPAAPDGPSRASKPAGDGPFRVELGRRQRDRDLRQARVRIEPAADAEHRNPLAGKRRLLFVEYAASGRGGGQQQRGEVAAVHARLTRDCSTRTGRQLRVSQLGFQRRGHFGGAGAQRGAPPDRRRVSIDFERAAAVSAFSFAAAVTSSAAARHGFPFSVNGARRSIAACGSPSGSWCMTASRTARSRYSRPTEDDDARRS